MPISVFFAIRAYSRTMLGATIASNLVLLVLKKRFSLETVKNDICSGVTCKQNAPFFRKYALKKCTHV